jgi:hypothetical protein
VNHHRTSAATARADQIDAATTDAQRAAEIDAMLSGLISDGRVRQEVNRGKTGPPTTRYIA